MMEFYDVGAKRYFKTANFRIVNKNGRKFALAKSPHGNYECWKVLPKNY